MALSDIVPINRKEEFLQAIADKSGAPVPVTRIEEFLKRISESSGGSSLPEYTSADKGKGLFLGDGEGTETVVIVPEQTVTVVDEGVALQNAEGVIELQEGYSVSLSVNGSSYDGTVRVFTDAVQVSVTVDDATYMIASRNGVTTFVAIDPSGFPPVPIPGTYTVSLSASVPTVEPTWEAAGGALIVTATDDVIEGVSCIILDKTGAEIEAKFPSVIVSYGGERSIVLKYEKTMSPEGNLYSVTTMPMAAQIGDLVFEDARGDNRLIYYLPT